MKTKVYREHVIEEGYDYYQLYFAVPDLVFWYDGDVVKTGSGETFAYEFKEARPERSVYRMQSLEDLEVPDELIARLREHKALQKTLEKSIESLNLQRGDQE